MEFLIQKLSYVDAIWWCEILCIPKSSDLPWEKEQAFSSCNAILIVTYVYLTCCSGVESALSFAKWIPRTSEVNCLILLIMNEIYLDAQIIPFVVFHSDITPSVGQAVPQNT